MATGPRARRRCAPWPCGCATSCHAGASRTSRGTRGCATSSGRWPGKLPAIVVAAHYDVEATPVGFVGANDGAAGTAAVVQLARTFDRTRRPRGARAVRFVLFDGEEEPAGCVPFYACGLRGSKAYAARHSTNVRNLILLDYIAEKRGLRFRREQGSDPVLWSRLRSAARAVGVGALFPPGRWRGRSLTTTRRSPGAASRQSTSSTSTTRRGTRSRTRSTRSHRAAWTPSGRRCTASWRVCGYWGRASLRAVLQLHRRGDAGWGAVAIRAAAGRAGEGWVQDRPDGPVLNLTPPTRPGRRTHIRY